MMFAKIHTPNWPATETDSERQVVRAESEGRMVGLAWLRGCGVYEVSVLITRIEWESQLKMS